jgi:hypothetical protein
MRCHLTTAIATLGCAFALTATTYAQTTESKTKIETEHGKAVKYTGCVQTGTEARTFVLQNVVPISRTEATGTSGTTTTTSYALVPEGKVVLEQQVGHKVEVSGVLVPAGKGDTKFKSRTKTEGTEQKTKGEVERGPLPQLKVLSVRQLAERCNP